MSNNNAPLGLTAGINALANVNKPGLAVRTPGGGLAPSAPSTPRVITKDMVSSFSRENLETFASDEAQDAGLRIHAMTMLRLLDKTAAAAAMPKGVGKDAAQLALLAKLDSLGVPHSKQTVKLDDGSDFEVFVYAGYSQTEGEKGKYSANLGADGKAILTGTTCIRMGRFPTVFYPEQLEAVTKSTAFLTSFARNNPRIKVAAAASKAAKVAEKGAKR